jgi:hypothetical protein
MIKSQKIGTTVGVGILIAIFAFTIFNEPGNRVTGFVTAANGTNYDVEFCVREGYSNVSGTSYDFIGSIGCPISGDFSIALDPSKGIANKGDIRFVNVTIGQLGGAFASVSLSASGLPANASVTFSPTNCISPCYSNLSISTSAFSPEGQYNISVSGSSLSATKVLVYNLTVLPSGTPATCGAPTTCDAGETQSNCASDCFTTASMPSPVSPGQIVTVSVEFHDFRYLANGKVSLDLRFDSKTGTAWNVANGCNIGGVKLGPVSENGAIAWPSGTISEDGHFKITTLCTIPSSISSGPHILFATPTIY